MPDDPLPWVFELPESHPLRAAHKKSIRNRKEIEASAVCGCFYCKKVFSARDVTEWTDSQWSPDETALCPRCGIDSVIADKAGFPLTPEFLAEMNKAWFS